MTAATPRTTTPWRAAERRLVNEDSPTVIQSQILASPQAEAPAELERRGLEPRSESDSVSSSHGDVTFVQRDESAATAVYAVKKQRIRWPKAFATEMAYRELRVLLQLRSLADRGLCANFVRIIEWFKASSDALLPSTTPSRRVSLALPPTTPSRQYMYYVLEFCDTTLDKQRDALSLEQVKSIAFQLLFALLVAQGEHEFAHLDLHLKNILLQTLDADQVLEYTVSSVKYRCASFMVKIADFGLSRITTDAGEVVYNDRQPLSDIFDNCKRKDVEMVEAHLQRIGRPAYERAAEAFGGVDAVPLDNDVSIDWHTLGHLRSRIRNGDPLAALLEDDYFDSLRVDARKPLPAAKAAADGRRASRTRTPLTKNRKSLGPKTTAVVVEAPTAVPSVQRFVYVPRAAPKVSAPPATTTHRHRTRSVHKEEQEQKRCASEKTRGKQLTTSSDENSPNDLGDIRKRLSFAPN